MSKINYVKEKNNLRNYPSVTHDFRHIQAKLKGQQHSALR